MPLSQTVPAMLLCWVVGCEQAQSFEEGVQRVCDMPRHFDGQPGEPMGALPYIDEYVTNSEARAMLREHGNLPPDEAARRLARISAELGITGCALVEHLRRGDE